MCGVIGVVGSPEAAKESFLGLITLQHRGQDAAGILSYDGVFHLVKNHGLVENVFSKAHIDTLTGDLAIGHTRYSTVGKGELHEVQPLVLNYPYGLGMVHNGNLVNYLSIKQKLANEMHRRCFSDSDSETLLNWFAHQLKDHSFGDLEAATRSVMDSIIGSYSVVGLIGDGANGGAGLFAFRDRLGLRPLVLGKKTIAGKTAYMLASETIPLAFLGYEYVRDIVAGELVYITREGQFYSSLLKDLGSPQKSQPARPCMFEWVYFAGAEGAIEKIPVYGARLNLGNRLAAEVAKKIAKENIKIDLVAPVPDTSRTAASAMAEYLHLPYREVLIKNRYIKRTFILNSQSNRESAVDLKLNPVVSQIKGKNILLVDDSIVRGTTSRKIIELVRQSGANKVYFVSTCPPIRYPCFYGIDFPDQNELIAYNQSEEKVAAMLGADGVMYQTIENLRASIQVEGQDLCMACLNGDYPTDITEGLAFLKTRKKHREYTASRA